MDGNKDEAKKLRDAARSCQEGGKFDDVIGKGENFDDVVEVCNREEESGTAVRFQWVRLRYKHSQIALRFKVDGHFS
jgi:hypothetical protein